MVVKKKVTMYETSDGRKFYGRGAKGSAWRHQRILDQDKKEHEFELYMRELFEIDKDDETQEEVFLQKAAVKSGLHVPIMMTACEFGYEFSNVIFKLFLFIGPDKWQKIHEFLTDETGN